ncbi:MULTISPECIES: sugar phosphate isomerase/epimerase [unclassified Parafrankia]|uniref:sugar phosphate isomerase/epimerase family protein n=1 Tax=unclassified Parafrankia TaxID=2994368 RepID=UPI000DA58684|nr:MULTISPECIES: TIM barrel protein [unclassified Parafrankia]TCJ31329.1 sugar phosphate isomerase/epimerase [Parafrankia sp. BMG5.11]CAI7977736.1 Xylose isomerase domain protein TIM barrel [Frankia sp. Hr75.2]SQD96727.1 Xylose isomerase domain protein TIM barrel [Parafrankia sp. Ea1.12]
MTSEPKVQLALTPDSRWDVDTAGLVAAAAGAGFGSVGLAEANADAAGAAVLAAAGLRCHEILALIVTDDEQATIDQARRVAKAAAAVNARWVLTGFRVGLDERSAPLIARCAALFAAAGAGMAVEFSPLGGTKSIATAVDIVEAAGPDRAGVLIDTWHFFNGESTWEQLEQVPLDRIAYVQFDDALPPISPNGIKETMHRRAMPGEGIFDLERFAATLLDRGWSGLVSVEVLNAELRGLPVAEFARRAYETTAGFWR